MSYHIYQTEGYVLESMNVGESNKLLTLFTKELGLVRAAAQNIRSSQSKLRYSVQEMSFGTFALVRGKEVWRLTSARKLISLYDPRLPVTLRRMFARLLALVVRLVPGEQKNTDLYAVLSALSAFCFSKEASDMRASALAKEIELLASLRVLSTLGYTTDASALTDIAQNNTWDAASLNLITENRVLVEKEIVKALTASHL
jgi:DNA repair protein RecO (recombination protein O)